MSTMLDRVSAWIEVNGRLVEHDHGGSLGRLRSRKEVELVVATEERAVAFSVNERSNASPVPAVDHKGHTCFARQILVKTGAAGKPDFVGFPDNHLGLVFLGKNGHLEMIKVGVLTQSGVNYVVTHPAGWQPRLFRDQSNQVVCPVFERWGTLRKVIVDGFQPYNDEFPLLPAGYTVPEETSSIPEGKSTGVVTWYEPFHGIGGTGAITTRQGMARVRWPEAPKREGTELRYLLKGENVQFKRLDKTQGDTKFTHDAYGVTLFD